MTMLIAVQNGRKMDGLCSIIIMNIPAQSTELIIHHTKVQVISQREGVLRVEIEMNFPVLAQAWERVYTYRRREFSAGAKGDWRFVVALRKSRRGSFRHAVYCA